MNSRPAATCVALTFSCNVEHKILTNIVDTWFGNSFETMAKLEVMNADKPRASTNRHAKVIMMNGRPGGHLSKVLERGNKIQRMGI